MDQENVEEAPRSMVLLDAIRTAKTMHTLQFLGNVIRIHKNLETDYTKDSELMSEFRDSFQQRMNELREGNDAETV